MTVTLGLSLFLTVLTVIVSLGGLLLFRKLTSADKLKVQHDITDPYSQFVGMLFAVLLGFMVADAMARFGDARTIVEQEASQVGNIFRLADGFPDAKRVEVQGLCLTYAQDVAEREWPLLAAKKTSPETWVIYRKLWKSCTQYEPVTPRQCSAQQAILPCLASLGDNRRLRVNALHNGLPPVLWVILIVGGLATVLFTYFFNADNLRMQMVMVGIVSLVICLNIFLLASYDDPFSGDVMVTPGAFQTQIKIFKEELNNSVKFEVD